MGKVLINSGGSSVDLDVITATESQILKSFVSVDNEGEPITGTLELTGNATNEHVLAGETYYNTDPHTKNTGTMENIEAIDLAKSIVYSGGSFYVRMSNGAHITNASSGYPEVKVDGSSFGDATAAYVYNGKYFTSSAGLKVKGTMTVSSVLSFSVAAYSTTQLLCTWKNPAQASGRPFSGVIICCKTGSYPTSPTDGYKYMGSGGNSTAQGTGSATISGLTAGTTYYLRIWSYCVCSAGNYTVKSTKVLTNGYMSATCATTSSGRKSYTSSGTYTIPSGVRTINVHLVGGGGAGRANRAKDYWAGGGGGGGYTAYKTGISVEPGNVVTFTIGAGGTETNTSTTSEKKTGGDTTVSINNSAATSLTASGGYTSGYMHAISGGKGGSGGGHGADFDTGQVEIGSAGASNGGSASGSGQGTTTREFGSSSGTLYSGGGGGGGGSRYFSGSSSTVTYAGQAGGSGGGGKGANDNGTPGNGSAGYGGGGGGGYYSSTYHAGGTGGCGCVVITW